jgi:hypothetical protein
LYRAYPFLERGGGILHDVGPNAHHGTFSSSTYRWGVGPIGPDKEFTNGGTDSVACPDWDVPTGSVTISAWIVVSGSSGDDRSVVGVDDSSGGLRTFQFRIDNSGVVPRFIVFYDGGSVAQAVGSALSVGKLVHMVGTNNKGTAKTALWIDGVKMSEVASGAMDNDTTTMFIGARDTPSTDEFWGFISDVRVWDRALAPSEILDLYADPWAMYTPVKRSVSAGVVDKTGTGALSMLMPTTAGVGEVGRKTAIGALTMLMATAAGVGEVGRKTATGALDMLMPTTAGVGEVGRKTATGGLDMLMATAAGVGILTGIRTATGALDMLMATAAGIGVLGPVTTRRPTQTLESDVPWLGHRLNMRKTRITQRFNRIMGATL